MQAHDDPALRARVKDELVYPAKTEREMPFVDFIRAYENYRDSNWAVEFRDEYENARARLRIRAKEIYAAQVQEAADAAAD